MNAPRRPAGDHDPDPDPDEPVTRWEVTACTCGRLLARPARVATRGTNGWRHLTDGSDLGSGWRP